MKRDQPTYPLARVKDLVFLGKRFITIRAGRDAFDLGFDETDIEECVDRLAGSDFDKSMPSDTAQGLWQDVYKTTFEGVALYVKVQIADHHTADEEAVIISFHRP